MKIQNNAVIEKCIDCNSYCYDGQDKKKGTIHCTRNAFKTVDRDIVDKDCPLQDVETFIPSEQITPSVDTLYWLLTKMYVGEKLVVDKIIIVKKKGGGNCETRN